MSLVEKPASRDPARRKFMPPMAGSPFGDFPKDYMLPKKKRELLFGAPATGGAAAAPTLAATLQSMGGSSGPLKPTMSSLRHTQGRAPGASAAARATRDAKLEAAEPKPTSTMMLLTATPLGVQFDGPPTAPTHHQAFAPRKIPPTEFRRYYERGDLPITIQHRGGGRILSWKVEAAKLDYHHYLPIFFDGLRELEEPYQFLARQGCMDMLDAGGAKILPTVPQLVIPMKQALSTRDPQIICTVLRVLQKLVVSGDLIGEALVPYYRQLLPALNLYKDINLNLGDRIEYSQRKQQNIGDLIHETLQLLERHGGEDAFINIKYMVPAYESCVLN